MILNISTFKTGGIYLLSIKSVNKSYNKKRVLKNITFDVVPGEVLSIVGHNGAGKTTLLKIMSGLLLPQSGEVKFEGELLKRKHLLHISMMLEGNRNFYGELTIEENIKYLYRLKGLKVNLVMETNIDKYLDVFNLKEHRSKPVYKLSRGMQQKVAVILNFVLPSKIILLDEPTLGLDIFSLDEFEKLIRTAKKIKKLLL